MGATLKGDDWQGLVATYGNGRRAVVDAVLRQVVGPLGDAGVITLLRPDGSTLEVVRANHADEVRPWYLHGLAGAATSRVGQGLAGVVAATGEALVLPTVPAPTLTGTPAHPTEGDRRAVRTHPSNLVSATVAIVPLRADGAPMGTLGAVRTDHRRPYTDDDVATLQHLARQVALALAHLDGTRTTREPDLYEAVFQHVGDGVVVTDERRLVLAANDAARRILGLGDADVAGAVGSGGVSLRIPDVGAATGIDLRAPGGPARIEAPMRRRDGTTFTASISSTTFRTATGQDRICVTIRDVTEEAAHRRELEELSDELGRLALQDDLTGLANRRGLRDRGTQVLAIADRERAPITVLFLDVNGLKRLNDTHGHAEGDRALQAVGRSLTGATRTVDVVARTGGDEFVVLLFGADAQAARRVIARVDRLLAQESRALEVPVAVSIGTAVRRPDDGTDLDELITRADQQMYRVRPGAG